ncbi:MAG: hypothetical protein PHV28_12635 [Kiritimatiellae bacterium]|nr:hypothetical protein [Kiritimatiellia bacterium]
MKKLFAAMGVAVCCISAFSAEFYWTSTDGSGNALFGSPSNWAVGRSADAGNPGNLVPGEADYIYQFHSTNAYARSYVFNLAATEDHPSNTWTIRGFTGFDDSYNPNTIFVIGGNFTVSETFSNTCLKVEVRSGCKFTIGPDAHSRISRGGCVSEYLVKSGGEAEFGGTYHLKNIKIENQAGGTFSIDPVAFNYDYYAREGDGTYPRTLDNSGTFNFPNGFDLSAPNSFFTDYTQDPPVFQIRQNAGTMTFGGDFTCSAAPGKMTFALNGGTLVANDSLSFTGITSLTMPAATTATVQIATGKTVDLSTMTFGDNTMLNVTGAGKLKLGESGPTVLNLTNVTDLVFIGGACKLTTVTGLAGVAVSAPDSALELDLVKSDDATLLQTLKAALDATGSMIGTFEIVNNRIHYSRSGESKVFYWKNHSSTTYCDWDLGSSWVIGTSVSGTNPDGLWPGMNDEIHYLNGYAMRSSYNLNGKHRYVKGFNWGNYTEQWGFRDLWYKNGTLEVTTCYTNLRVRAVIEQNGTLILGPNCGTKMGYSGAQNTYTVKNTGTLVVGGYVCMNMGQITVQPGGTLTFDPKTLELGADMGIGETYASFFDNSGTANFPHGAAFAHGLNHSELRAGIIRFKQQAGTMTFGGAITRAADAYGDYQFQLLGGSAVFNESSDFSFFSSVGMPTADTTATLEVAADKTVDWVNATFAAGTTLAKTGDGTLALGEAAPSTLNVTSGIIRTVRATQFNTLAMGAGTTLELASAGVVLDALPGYADIDFAVDATDLVVGAKLLTSADATLLAAIQANATVPEGYALSITGDALILTISSADHDVFTAAGEKNIADVSGWSRGNVPAAGADVYVAGQDTVAVLGATNMVYNSITVLDGATLKVSGAFTLPPVILSYDSRVLFDSGSEVTLAVGAIAAYAEPATLPVVEVASGAKVLPAANFEFKNVHLKNYGKIQCATPAYFGTAEVGETAYFALTAVNGEFDFLGIGINRWVQPKASGGRVKVVGKVSFKDSTVSTSNQSWFKYQVGNANPTNEIIDFELDNTLFDIRDNGANYFGGAVRVKCFNNGKVEKPSSSTSPGLYGQPNFNDRVQLDFDGAGTRFLYNLNRYFVMFSAGVDGHEQMTFRNGGYIHVMKFGGNGKSVFGFEDGYWDLTEKPGYDPAYWDTVDGGVPESRTQEYLVKPFTGLKSVRIGAGKFLGLRSYSANAGTKQEREWNRVIELANVPVTGTNGTLFLTNATPGYSCMAIMTCTSNTATGDLLAYPSADGCRLLLADGANWAGTLVAGETIGFTNLTSAALPAKISVGNVRFTGKLPIRVWKGATTTNDTVKISGMLTAGAAMKTGFEPMLMSGSGFTLGDEFVLGSCPAAALAEGWEHAFTTSEWRLTAEGGGDTVTLKIVYAPVGSVISIL